VGPPPHIAQMLQLSRFSLLCICTETWLAGCEDPALFWRRLHDMADSDRNGKASIEELEEFTHSMQRRSAEKHVASAFTSMDINGDRKLSEEEASLLLGEISQDEWKSSSEKNMQDGKFVALDKNRDAHLSLDEFKRFIIPDTSEEAITKAVHERMSLKDVNNDEQLSLDEFVGEGKTEHAKIGIISMFKQADSDGNGHLSRDEMKALQNGSVHAKHMAAKIVKLADTDDDLHVTINELHTAHANLKRDDINLHMAQWAYQLDL